MEKIATEERMEGYRLRNATARKSIHIPKPEYELIFCTSYTITGAEKGAVALVQSSPVLGVFTAQWCF
jgi:hypothetical protein